MLVGDEDGRNVAPGQARLVQPGCELSHAQAGGREFFFCHAGVEQELPLELQQPKDLLWIRGRFYRGYHGAATVVVGHTATEKLRSGCREPIWLKNHILLLDTGSYLPKGRISCVDVLSGEVWQSDDIAL